MEHVPELPQALTLAQCFTASAEAVLQHNLMQNYCHVHSCHFCARAQLMTCLIISSVHLQKTQFPKHILCIIIDLGSLVYCHAFSLFQCPRALPFLPLSDFFFFSSLHLVVFFFSSLQTVRSVPSQVLAIRMWRAVRPCQKISE